MFYSCWYNYTQPCFCWSMIFENSFSEYKQATVTHRQGLLQRFPMAPFLGERWFEALSVSVTPAWLISRQIFALFISYLRFPFPFYVSVKSNLLIKLFTWCFVERGVYLLVYLLVSLLCINFFTEYVQFRQIYRFWRNTYILLISYPSEVHLPI